MNGSTWVVLAVVVFIGGLFSKNLDFNGLFKTTPKLFPVQLVGQFSTSKEPYGDFGAWGVCSLPDGKIALTDNNSKRILVLGINGKLYKSIVRRGSAGDDFHDIRSISADSHGDIYVFDSATVNIFGFTPEGKLLKVIPAGKIGGFYGPIGFCCAGNKFVIADTGSHRILTLNADGSLASVWGHHGDGADEFTNPLAVTVDKQGRYYIADSDNHRIKITDSKGKTIRIIKLMDKPFNLALDKSGRIYVTFNDDNFVQVYSSKNGKYLGTFDPITVANPQRQVIGVCVTPDGLIVAEGPDQVSIYKVAETTSAH